MRRVHATTWILALVAVSALACGPGELTADAAQTMLDREVGPGTITVLGMRTVSESETVARISLRGAISIEVDVAFELFDTGWRPSAVEMADRSFPFPEFVETTKQGRQRLTMASMRDLAIANGTKRVDSGSYAASLEELAGYMDEVPLADDWGNAFVYASANDSYTITSLGSDGQPGPAPPTSWKTSPFEVDIVVSDGQFTQAPTGR